MKWINRITRYALLVSAALLLAGCGASQRQPAVAHTVFFTLHNPADEMKDSLVSDCYGFLQHHPGVVSFYAGTLAPDMDRPVNIRDFDVSLHMVFRNAAAHARYQTSPRHLEFIEHHQANWKQVRVFDTYVDKAIQCPGDRHLAPRHPSFRLGFGTYGRF